MHSPMNHLNSQTTHIPQPLHSYSPLPLPETEELIEEEYGELRDRVEERIRELEDRLPANQIDPTLTRATLRPPQSSYGQQYFENPHQHHHGINSACKYCVMEKEYTNLTKVQARNLHSPSISSNSSHYNGPMQVCPQVESMYAIGEGYGLGHGEQRERDKERGAREREGNHVPLVEKLPLQSNRSNQNSSYPSSGTLNPRGGDSVISINEALMENLRVQKEMNSNLKALSEKLEDLSLRRSDSGSGYDEQGRQGLISNQDPYINSHVNTHSHINTQSHPNLTNPSQNNRREFQSNQYHGNLPREYNNHDYYYGQPSREQYRYNEREEYINGYTNNNKNNNNRRVYEQPREGYFEDIEEPRRHEKVYVRNGKYPEGRSESHDGYMRYTEERGNEDKNKNMRNHRFYPNYQRNERSNNSSKHSESAQGRAKSVSVYSSSVAESRKKSIGLRGVKEISSPKKSRFSRTRNNNSSKDSENEKGVQRKSSHSRRKMESEYFVSRRKENREEDGGNGVIRSNNLGDYPDLQNNHYCPLHTTNEVIHMYEKRANNKNKEIYRDAQYRNKKHEKEHLMQAFSQQEKARKELLNKIGKNFYAAYGVK